MDLYRFHLPDLAALPPASAVATLPPDQSHHARAVLRLNQGDAIILFDGKGAWVRAKVQHVGKSAVTALLGGPITVDPPNPLQLTLATAVPKGDRAEWLIEQASQLDVAAVQWLDCDRGVVKPRDGGHKIDKWRRLAFESAKQCGRTHVLEVLDLVGVRDLLKTASESKTLWLDPGPGGRNVAEALGGMRSGKIRALIGPEGGWSDAESVLLRAAAAAGTLQRVRLTSTVLRIETAAAAIAALVMSA